MKTIKLPFKLKWPMLACGADMKGSFALAMGETAYLEDGFGDLADPDNLSRYKDAVTALENKLKLRPKLIICDLHPGYFSTRFAENAQRTTRNSRLYKVQHHEAHVASAMTDNSIKASVIGVAFDGTGFGTDGKIWGGEFFVGSPKSFKRAAHLEYLPMPGADAAIREPWRMAVSYLYRAFGDAFTARVKDADKALFIKTMIDKGINSPLASSAGRLFDAAASLILGREKAAFEAELPMELEKMAPKGYEERYDFDLKDERGVSVLHAVKTVKGIVRDLSAGIDRRLVSGRFHNTVAEMITRTASRLKKRCGIDRVVLSGGVFQNRYLTAKVTSTLRADGFKVYIHSRVSTTDAGIPLGQIAIAQARLTCA